MRRWIGLVTSREQGMRYAAVPLLTSCSSADVDVTWFLHVCLTWLDCVVAAPVILGGGGVVSAGVACERLRMHADLHAAGTCVQLPVTASNASASPHFTKLQLQHHAPEPSGKHGLNTFQTWHSLPTRPRHFCLHSRGITGAWGWSTATQGEPSACG